MKRHHFDPKLITTATYRCRLESVVNTPQTYVRIRANGIIEPSWHNHTNAPAIDRLSYEVHKRWKLQLAN